MAHILGPVVQDHIRKVGCMVSSPLHYSGKLYARYAVLGVERAERSHPLVVGLEPAAGTRCFWATTLSVAELLLDLAMHCWTPVIPCCCVASPS